LGSLLVAAVLLGGCRSTEDIQRDYAKKITPTGVAAAPVADTIPEKALRSMKVRVWVDGDYQRQTLRWEDRVLAQFDRANRVLVPQFGVRLDVVEVKPWDNTPRDSLPAHVQALRARDDGNGVDWVVGFVSSVERVATSHDQIGWAEYFGKHWVARGMVSAAETDAIQRSLDKLSPSELDRVTRERRLHRETAALLHEWAHTLGAIHERSPEWLMSPAIDSKQVSFSAASIRLIEVGLEFRGSTSAALLKAWAREYRAALEAYPADLAESSSREAALASTQSIASGAFQQSPASSGGQDAASTLRQAKLKLEGGDTAGAWALIEPLSRTAKDDPVVQSYACHIAAQRASKAEDTVTLCRTAISMEHGISSTRLALAHVHLVRKEPSSAVEALQPMESALEKDPGSGTDLWLALGQTYQRAGALTDAERVAAKAGKSAAVQQLLKDCRQDRRRLAVFAVQPEREVAYVEAMRTAQTEVERSRLTKARALARDLERQYPGAPGAALIGCLVEAKAASLSRTQVACSRARTTSPDLIEPHYWLGLVSLQQNRWPEARAELGKACDLDESGDYWWRVGSWYQQANDSKALADLRERYRARFGHELRAGR
ncbi:MAG TPA: hypothetical protein VFF12_00635, partial [Myxococcaceae bacterium]|nr:hypothetical protein [Myxococcaceae bacterium]